MQKTGGACPSFGPGEMGDEEFRRFSEFIQGQLGIKMPPSKKVLLQSRFQKRLRALGMGSYREYCDYVFSPEGGRKEMQNLVDVVTTNTTHFFREPKHFEVLTRNVLPEMAAGLHGRPLRIWSAGCSSGQEPYTLGIVLSEFRETCPGFDFRILATDISMEILQKASRAVYPMEAVEELPLALKRKYMLKSKDGCRVKMDRSLRDKVGFRQVNFMEDFRLDHRQDIIFCRNVVIYFDRPTQERLFSKFCDWLAPGGYLFIGHSESLSGMRLPLQQLVPTVFRRHA